MSEHETPDRSGLVPESLLRAVRYLLRPLVRLLLAYQVTYPVLQKLLKSVYLEMAERDFSLDGRRQTASRLSLLTGIHRKDVRRLREESADAYTPPPSVSLGARLVAQWTGAPEFRGEDGRPLPLQRGSGAGPSFDALVASVSKDIRARPVLDEWRRLGVVTVDDEGLVRLVVDAFVPSRGFDEKAHYFGRNLHDHIAAGAHNLEDASPPLLERSVYYDGLSPESVRELAELAERTGMDALQAVNRRARELQERDEARPESRLRINFGAYFFHTDETPEGEGDA